MPDEKLAKPCLALMGEFSAGKSTLANLLIGYHPLPVQVVATQLPPVRISYGTDAPFGVDQDGETFDLDVNDLGALDLNEAVYLQLFSTEDMLQHCDLIDMPGISDPNMPAEIWEQLIGEVDGVLWCSPATQAWRQSEAAVWAEFPEELYQHSLLLLTRMDKLSEGADRERVLSRVRQETAGLFADVLPISLLHAIEEQNNPELWAKSGAEGLAARLIALLADLAPQVQHGRTGLRLPGLERTQAQSSIPQIIPRRVVATENRRARPV